MSSLLFHIKQDSISQVLLANYSLIFEKYYLNLHWPNMNESFFPLHVLKKTNVFSMVGMLLVSGNITRLGLCTEFP